MICRNALLSAASICFWMPLPCLAEAPAAYPVPPARPVADQHDNQQIDYAGFLRIAKEVEPYREKRRLTEEQFLAMAKEPGTIVLDTRGPDDYKLVHFSGAVRLGFAEINKQSLAKVFPDKQVRILIYCNNNFVQKIEKPKTKKPLTTELPAFSSNLDIPFRKGRSEALNIPTFINLYGYGYKNVYELGPAVDPNKSILPWVSGEEQGPQPSSGKAQASI